MTIRSKLHLIVLFGIISIFIIITLIVLEKKIISDHASQYETANQLYSVTNQLNILTYEYLFQREERILQQWNTSYDKLGQLFLGLNPLLSEQELHQAYSQYKGLKHAFDKLLQKTTECYQKVKNTASASQLCRILEQRMLNQVLVNSQNLIALSHRITKESYKHLTSILQQFSDSIALIIIVLVALSSIIAIVITRSITSGISKLLIAMKCFAQGQYDTKLHIQGNDELSQMTTAFLEMTHARKLAEDRLNDLNANLELRICERTVELSQANEKIQQLNEQLKSENIRMSAELDVTRRLQQMILPQPEELKQIDQLDIASFMEPAKEIGGDYYDVLNHEGHTTIGIGDVTGHGLESGMIMLMVQMSVRILTLIAKELETPKHMVSIINRALFDNVQRMRSDKNLTLTLADYYNGTLYLTGQHEETLIVRKDSSIERIDTFDLGFMVGLQPDIQEYLNCITAKLDIGDGLVLYTDGITEAFSPSNELYGLERLCHVIREHWHQEVESIKNAVVSSVYQYMGKQQPFDDITLLVVKRIA
ncbi:SpoIIE family protein phosphatase [Candidatus Albibeggiatoa sp. nov. NOAA]|uniref:SpoIIE family protein phosphatase n=1 Tax=Candidatus Albibeggiatoa sp. nov. NOAA TaxID=3162724 RepID=UPI0032FFB62C|nr:SpoIIE family protein phosphatase [Thiotrichaceae bacterium]